MVIERPDVHLAVVDRHAPVGRTAADARARPDLVRLARRADGEIRVRNLGIAAPLFFSGGRIERHHDAPRQRRVHHAVGNQGRALNRAAVRIRVVIPGEPDLAHVARVNLFEFAVAPVHVTVPGRQPLVRVLARVQQRLGVLRLGCGRRKPRRHQQRQRDKPHIFAIQKSHENSPSNVPQNAFCRVVHPEYPQKAPRIFIPSSNRMQAVIRKTPPS